jgi:hypothetical protein
MKANRIFAAATAAVLAVSLLAGCGSASSSVATSEAEPVETAASEAASSAAASETTTTAASEVKTGFAMITSVSDSTSATADANGKAQSNINMAAVTVDENGVIQSCVVDVIQASINFDANGAIVTDISTEFQSKNELGDNYGMKVASGIGKEWDEQAAALAAYVVGKTANEVRGISVDESGKATDADLLSGATVHINGYLEVIAKAADNAEYRGAKAGDKLSLTSVTNMEKSKDAADGTDGTAQAYATAAAITMDGDVVTSCYIDAVQANVKFNTKGEITSDLDEAPASKNELGEDYGMKAASGIGKEWYEQAEAFGTFVEGKTAAEITGLAADNTDLLSSVTIGTDAFKTLIAKAAQ